MDNFWETIIISLLSASVVSLINYWLVIKRQIVFELKENQKRTAYLNFLNKSKAFLNDPGLSKEEKLKNQKEFIEKVYNEIWISASDEVLESISDFFESVSIASLNEDDDVDGKAKALKKLVFSIRKDLGLKTNKETVKKYKIYAPNLEALDKE